MKTKYTVLAGDKFNDLTAVRLVGRDGNRGLLWVFRCKCGTEKEISLYAVISGNTRSCGCYKVSNPPKVTHGFTRGLSKGGKAKPGYHTWQGMIRRCGDPNNPKYPIYGGRGIKVCERWMKFSNFISDMGAPAHGQSIDRINNNGNYEPGNCRWATTIIQNNNTRQNHRVTHNGITLTVSEWARKMGITRSGMENRLRRGKSVINT